jgi:hypothetical protein
MIESDIRIIQAASELRDLMNRRHRLELASRWYPDEETRAELEALDARIRLARRAVAES